MMYDKLINLSLRIAALFLLAPQALFAESSQDPVFNRCTHVNPTVSISPASLTNQPGGTNIYKISTKNNDAKACGSSVFDITAKLPNGFSQTIQTVNPPIGAGVYEFTYITVVSDANVAPGSYPFTITVENSNNKSASGSAKGTFVVQNIPTSGTYITIAPSGASFGYSSTAEFTVTIIDNQQGIANLPLQFSIVGGISWTVDGTTNANGVFQYSFEVTPAYAAGPYLVEVSAVYNNKSISATSSFAID